MTIMVNIYTTQMIKSKITLRNLNFRQKLCLILAYLYIIYIAITTVNRYPATNSGSGS